ncbi:5'/3'-nucleotidase SurE [Haloarchaeobius sp. DYHT-AS-18]|uniref:5'/3'-nucleotidase SurE n=1 Tax=Haloarchaeobius sp. DYHT-AS-18 TaxID=3446117 RepID=UPI003EC0969B
MARPRVLLTNDDGIDAVGLHALHDGLRDVADVTVVAPTEDQSGAGRRKSYTVEAHEHERGTALDGTPVDCVAVGRYQSQPAPDLVVAGCNPGPNIGAHKLSQSGTVSAAMEAAFPGIPGIAVSAYDPEVGGLREFERSDFDEAVRVTRFLVERLHDADWLGPDWYFNVTVPTDRSRDDELRLTRPARGFDRRVVEGDGDRELTFDNRFYDPVVPERDAPAPDPDTDLGACADHVTSVSPLHVGVETIEDERLAEAFTGFGDDA